MPIGAPRPWLLARLIQWVKSAFQGAQTYVVAPIAAGELPSLFAPRFTTVCAAGMPVSLAPVADFAATLRTFVLAARLRSVAKQNVRCSLKGPRKRRAGAAGKPLPKPAPRVLKRYSTPRALQASPRKCRAGWSIHTADVVALPEKGRKTKPMRGERVAA